MEERPAGAYIQDEQGNLTPDLNDQAMRERHEAAQAVEPPAAKRKGGSDV